MYETIVYSTHETYHFTRYAKTPIALNRVVSYDSYKKRQGNPDRGYYTNYHT